MRGGDQVGVEVRRLRSEPVFPAEPRDVPQVALQKRGVGAEHDVYQHGEEIVRARRFVPSRGVEEIIHDATGVQHAHELVPGRLEVVHLGELLLRETPRRLDSEVRGYVQVLRSDERSKRGGASREMLVRAFVVARHRERARMQFRHEVLLQALTGGVELIVARAAPRGVAAERPFRRGEELLNARGVRLRVHDAPRTEGRDE
mmetsp:Transcript_7692/g.32696  ORF Transcript_7692/g.32696 Transcript_7692/m.32696 type:complete len:203 (+) Transcript_7692:862-1470(+)